MTEGLEHFEPWSLMALSCPGCEPWALALGLSLGRCQRLGRDVERREAGRCRRAGAGTQCALCWVTVGRTEACFEAWLWGRCEL